MRTIRLAAALAAAVFVPAVSISVAAQDTQTFTVDCSRGQTITKALELGDARKPLVLVVRGTCNENVRITRDRVTLQGDPPKIATVQAANPDAHTIAIMATWVSINGLTVTGGLNGIWTTGVSHLNVTDSVIQNAAQSGINLNSSYGRLMRNTIQSNGSDGLMLQAATAALSNNEISMNAGSGIRLNGNSTLNIAGGAISANGIYGIYLTGGSDGLINGATISGNGTNSATAVAFKGGASIQSSTAQFSNASISNNLGRGLIVNNGGYVDAFNITVTGSAGEGVIAYLGGVATINGGAISGNGGNGLWLGVHSTAQIGNNVSIMDNAQNGIQLSQGSKLWTFASPITVGGNAWWGLLCNDNESSAADLSNITFSANGAGSASCTGY